MPVTASSQGTPPGFRGSTNLTAGLLARGCFAAHRLPRAYNPSGALMSRSPLTVAGAAAESERSSSSPHSLFTPPRWRRPSSAQV